MRRLVATAVLLGAALAAPLALTAPAQAIVPTHAADPWCPPHTHWDDEAGECVLG
ncbi:hypothetical protein OG696_40500 [Streptomyces sp. NBC_00656]|uniref:hypothetical protein n=1 Tax=Streptomyces sp. NBC_00656 TaxID=2903668 RepID=UPI003250C462